MSVSDYTPYSESLRSSVNCALESIGASEVQISVTGGLVSVYHDEACIVENWLGCGAVEHDSDQLFMTILEWMYPNNNIGRQIGFLDYYMSQGAGKHNVTIDEPNQLVWGQITLANGEQYDMQLSLNRANEYFVFDLLRREDVTFDEFMQLMRKQIL